MNEQNYISAVSHQRAVGGGDSRWLEATTTEDVPLGASRDILEHFMSLFALPSHLGAENRYPKFASRPRYADFQSKSICGTPKSQCPF